MGKLEMKKACKAAIKDIKKELVSINREFLEFNVETTLRLNKLFEDLSEAADMFDDED